MYKMNIFNSTVDILARHYPLFINLIKPQVCTITELYLGFTLSDYSGSTECLKT